MWELLKSQGFRFFFHLNINSVLSKIDKLRDITNHIKLSILGITKSELGSSVKNAEVNINGYSTNKNDRRRNGGGGACYN